MATRQPYGMNPPSFNSDYLQQLGVLKGTTDFTDVLASNMDYILGEKDIASWTIQDTVKNENTFILQLAKESGEYALFKVKRIYSRDDNRRTPDMYIFEDGINAIAIGMNTDDKLYIDYTDTFELSLFINSSVNYKILSTEEYAAQELESLPLSDKKYRTQQWVDTNRGKETRIIRALIGESESVIVCNSSNTVDIAKEYDTNYAYPLYPETKRNLNKPRFKELLKNTESRIRTNKEYFLRGPAKLYAPLNLDGYNNLWSLRRVRNSIVLASMDNRVDEPIVITDLRKIDYMFATFSKEGTPYIGVVSENVLTIIGFFHSGTSRRTIDEVATSLFFNSNTEFFTLTGWRTE